MSYLIRFPGTGKVEGVYAHLDYAIGRLAYLNRDGAAFTLETF